MNNRLAFCTETPLFQNKGALQFKKAYMKAQNEPHGRLTQSVKRQIPFLTEVINWQSTIKSKCLSI